MLAGLITWCYSVQWMVREESLDEKRRLRYIPERVKKRTIRLTILSTMLVTLFGFTTVMVQFMYHENRIGSNVLAMLETQMVDGSSIGMALDELDTERYTGWGETVSDMLAEDPALLNYAMFIGAFCVSLRFLGVDTATLLASIGLMSFAVSLGAKDIVADILAGLSLVFERTYYVGDVVQIGDFKGKVLEIGIRSTKLLSDTQDVKIISNHEIGSVINCSKQNSVCTVRITRRG